MSFLLCFHLENLGNSNVRIQIVEPSDVISSIELVLINPNDKEPYLINISMN